MTDEQIHEILRNQEARQILEHVADRRKVDLREVEASTGLDSETTQLRLGSLKEAQLIEELAAPIREFTVYFPTAEGLRINRQLQRSGGWW